MQCFTNGTVNLQYVPIKTRHNIRRINPYKSDTNVEYINPKNTWTISTYDHQVYTSVLYQSLETRHIIRLRTKTLALIHIGCAREVFHDDVILFTWDVHLLEQVTYLGK